MYQGDSYREVIALIGKNGVGVSRESGGNKLIGNGEIGLATTPMQAAL